jgi:dihydrofolate reductase
MSSWQMHCVVAQARNRVIGDGKTLLWHLPGDLPRVKALTMGCALIMGRRTFESIGRPLPGRASVVLTRQPEWQADGALSASSLAEAVQLGTRWLEEQGTGETRLILFGGGEIYQAGLPYCQQIELTEVASEPDGAARFPQLDRSDWQEELLETHPAGPHWPAFSHHRLTRKSRPQPLPIPE